MHIRHHKQFKNEISLSLQISFTVFENYFAIFSLTVYYKLVLLNNGKEHMFFEIQCAHPTNSRP